MDNKEYHQFVTDNTPKSKLFTNCIKAFLIGGAICTIGECLQKFYEYLGVGEEIASPLVTVTLVFFGTLLTGLNVYPKLAKHGGAGTLVPVTGFANSVAAPALEAKTEGFVLGTGAKIFTIAGPVILFGSLASVVAGILYYLWGLIQM